MKNKYKVAHSFMEWLLESQLDTLEAQIFSDELIPKLFIQDLPEPKRKGAPSTYDPSTYYCSESGRGCTAGSDAFLCDCPEYAACNTCGRNAWSS